MTSEHRLATTRPGFPELWGLAEITEYANQAADRHPDVNPVVEAEGRRINRHRINFWVKQATFPDPVARLMMGPVYLAEEAAPWVDEYVSRRPKTAPIPPELVREIGDERGFLSAAKTAQKYGVATNTVTRIWQRLEKR